MTNDLTWKLKAQPTAGELADLVKMKVLTADEARDIIFNKGKRNPASKKTTNVHFLLDGSGSMESCRNETIKGFNEYINTLKEDGGKYKFSLTVFDTDINGLRLKKPHKGVYIDDVPELTRKTFVPSGGTPLNDAFCTVLSSMESRPNEKNLFVVLTDGGENSSRKFSADDVKDLKREKENEGNWTFVYLGANQDAFEVSQTYAFTASNTSNFNATDKGIGVTFANLARSTSMYSGSASMNTSTMFTKEQQDENEQTK